ASLRGADERVDEGARAGDVESPGRRESFGARAAAGVDRARRLLVCLDGVPLEVVRMARGRGMFEFFREPSALLSPFPTMTNVALASMFKATPPHGYESLYFDREARALRGGIGKYIGPRTPDKVPSSYMDELDYQEPLPFEFLVYVAPDAVWRADVQRFRERFDAAPRTRDFFAFLKATDGLLHCRGTERLLAALQSLDKVLRDVRAHAGEETEIVLFSDHGMNLHENRRIHLQTHLRARGFRVADHFGPPDARASSSSDRARSGGSVAAPAFGLCGYAALYCARETDPAWVAAALSSLEGVDFSVHRDGADVVVRGARGTARIRREEKGDGEVRFAYETSDGDPLSLASVREELAASGELDARGFAPDRAWLARTGSHTYPDALANLHGALHGARVRHTADVLVSTLDGYYYGSTAFGYAVTLRATHGNAMRPSTHAFLMSTHRTFPPHVRATEARPYLRD
ncbi:MAG: alkaline phosphatase family protein, partial [Acidobacteriota bacterium]|nr:alkaline phosphatase family protein [Acidobacteriota bacterium]